MKKGYTLIELVTIMALFSIVMLVGMSFLFGAKNNFQRSQENSDMHYQARIASDFIRDEIRNATTLDLITIPMSFSDDGNQYLFVQGGILKYVENGIVYDKTSNLMIEKNPMFSLNLETSKMNTLAYNIEVTIDNSLGMRVYNVDTTIHLNNIRMKDAASGQCIKYTKPN